MALLTCAPDDDGAYPDLLCGAGAAWYQNVVVVSDPNAVTSDANSPVVCCVTAALVNLQASDGSVYLCCPLPDSVGPSLDPTLSCCPSNLLEEVTPDYDDGYGYYD